MYLVEKVDFVEKVTKTIKVSLQNHERIVSLKGKLEMIRKRNQTFDDAISYLFENQKEKSERS